MNLARYYIHIFFFFSGHASTVFKEERPLGEGLPINCFFSFSFFIVIICIYYIFSSSKLKKAKATTLF